MQSFFRFYPSPSYPSLDAFYAELPIPDGRKEYALPVRANDTLSFIIDRPDDVDPEGLKLSLATASEIIAEDIGTIVASADHLFCTVNIPLDIDFGCYTLLLHGQADNSTPWTYQSHTCELDSFGRKTGWALITETRNAAFSGFALLRSNFFTIGYHPETVLVEFTDERDVFGFFYTQNPGFIQRIRLHLSLSKPRPTVAESNYRLTNGTYRNQNVSIGKKYLLTTGKFDELTHDAIAVALKHSTFQIDSRNFSAEGIFEADFVETPVNVRRHADLYHASVDVFDEDFYTSNIDCISDDDIQTPCPAQYEFTVTQKIGLSLSGGVFTGNTSTTVNMFVTVAPFGGAVRYTYSGILPPGLTLLIIDNGIAVVGLPTTPGSYSITLLAKNGSNMCGSLGIAFLIEASTDQTIEYADKDYNRMDYN